MDSMGAGDGYTAFVEAFAQGLEPDPELWLDTWSEQHIELPKEIASEHGNYNPDRTVGAREILRWLSPSHPCQRVVVVGPSQFLKTQVALNAFCGWIDAAPGNILALEPTGGLAKRLSARVGKMFEKTAKLAGKIAEPRSRDARNTIDTKEFDGGTLYVVTAGSASNLAEVMARYLFGDEIDRWEGDLEGEGDPVKIAENRTTTYRYNRKMYYASSPVRPGISRILRLHAQGTQNVILLPCPHCGEYQELVQENLQYDDELTAAWFVCVASGCVIQESAKEDMLARYRLEPRSPGDGETESIHLSAFVMPPGRITWLDMAREYAAALAAIESGLKDPHALMQVYCNTRLARGYSSAVEVADPQQLAERADGYDELTVPHGGLVLTAGIDVQHDRLAVVIRAWGRGEESWLVYWGEISGQTLIPNHGAWLDLEKLLYGEGRIRHANGAPMIIRAQSIDSGDGATQEAVYSFVRKWKHRGAMATKGHSERSQKKREIFEAPPPSVDLDRKQKAAKYGLRVFMVGTHAAKNLVLKVRLPLQGMGPNRMHWYRRVRTDYWEQLTSEVEVPGKVRGQRVWECKAGVRNEGLDCEVLAVHAARSLKTHLVGEQVWVAIEAGLRQSGLFAAAAEAAPETLDTPAPEAAQDTPEAPAPSAPVSAAQPAVSAPRAEEQWLDDHDNWLT